MLDTSSFFPHIHQILEVAKFFAEPQCGIQLEDRLRVQRLIPPRPVHGWFIEGFDTADLKEAKALLEELS